jgi:ABC-2 type transport system ATP-binding protein
VDRSVAERRIDELAAAFGLAAVADRPVGGYSGGQRRRLEIARALVSEPQVLFLDEPTVGLDPRIRHELLGLIDGLRTRSGMTIVLTTHYLDEAERLCDRVAIVHRGRVVALDTPRALLAGLGRAVVEVHVDGDIGAALTSLRAGALAAGDAFAVGSTILVPLHDRPAGQAMAVITALGIPVLSMGSRAPSLDDVYLRLTGDRLADAA